MEAIIMAGVADIITGKDRLSFTTTIITTPATMVAINQTEAICTVPVKPLEAILQPIPDAIRYRQEAVVAW
jgi:hypothetical protein